MPTTDVYKRPTNAGTIKTLAAELHQYILKNGGLKIFLEALIYSFRTNDADTDTAKFPSGGVGGLDPVILRLLIDLETTYLNYIKRYDDNENVFNGTAWTTQEVFSNTLMPEIREMIAEELRQQELRHAEAAAAKKVKARRRR